MVWSDGIQQRGSKPIGLGRYRSRYRGHMHAVDLATKSALRRRHHPYQATLEKNPTAWLVHYNLGVELAKAGWSQEVIEHYQQALRYKSDDAQTHSNLRRTT